MEFFAPELFIPKSVTDISFYEKAFGAKEHFRFSNEDGSIHVAELSIGNALFHVHEVMNEAKFFSPQKYGACTACIGLFVEDVRGLVQRAIDAGAELIEPVKDHDYGYRQGMVRDPFGHYWQIQRKMENG